MENENKYLKAIEGGLRKRDVKYVSRTGKIRQNFMIHPTLIGFLRTASKGEGTNMSAILEDMLCEKFELSKEQLVA